MDLFTYPQTAGYKEATTSRDAAASVDARHLRGMVKRAFRSGPATADEVAERLGLSILSCRPRVTELARLGMIEETGERRDNASGRKAKVWRLAA